MEVCSRSQMTSSRRVGCSRLISSFFFFQAEDGIRDVAVTGVQTCALPIFVVGLGGVLGVGEKKVVVPWSDLKVAMTTDGKKPTATMNEAKLEAAPRYERSEIGRASCRERV